MTTKNKISLWLLGIILGLFLGYKLIVVERFSIKHPSEQQAVVNRELLFSYRDYLQKGEYAEAENTLQKMRYTMKNPFANGVISFLVDKFPQIRSYPWFAWMKKIKHFFRSTKNITTAKKGFSVIIKGKNGVGSIFLASMPFASNEVEDLPGAYPSFVNFMTREESQLINPEADVYWISMPSPTELHSSYDNKPIKINGIEAAIPFNKENKNKILHGDKIRYANIEPMFDHSASSAIDGRLFKRRDFVNLFKEAEAMRLKGSNIVINCAAGKSRSTTVLTCFLMEKFNLSLFESSALISAQRPQVGNFWSRNIYQRALLVSYFLDKMASDKSYQSNFFKKNANIIAENLFLCFNIDFKKVDDYEQGYSNLPKLQMLELIKKLKNNISEEKYNEIKLILLNKMKSLPSSKIQKNIYNNL